MRKETYSNLPVSTTNTPPPGNPERYIQVFNSDDGKTYASVERKKNLAEILGPGLIGGLLGPFMAAQLSIFSLIPGTKQEGQPPNVGTRLVGLASLGSIIGSIYSKTIGKYVVATYAALGSYMAFKTTQHELKYPYTTDDKATYRDPDFKNVEKTIVNRYAPMLKKSGKESHKDKLASEREKPAEEVQRR